MPLHPSKVPGGNELLNAKEVLEKAGITEGMKVGDLGCGSRGYFSLQAAKIVGKPGLVYAVDILKSNLQSVENEAKILGLSNVKTVWTDLEIYGATKIPASSLDFALLINVLFQTKDHQTIIKEAARLLKKDGKILVVDWKRTGAPFGPRIEERVSPEKIEEYAKLAGLVKELKFEAGPYHYGLVFKKL